MVGLSSSLVSTGNRCLIAAVVLAPPVGRRMTDNNPDIYRQCQHSHVSTANSGGDIVFSNTLRHLKITLNLLLIIYYYTSSLWSHLTCPNHALPFVIKCLKNNYYFSSVFKSGRNMQWTKLQAVFSYNLKLFIFFKRRMLQK